MNTDITGVRFSDEARWGEKKVEHDKFKIIDERLLEEKIKEKEHIQEADEEQEPESEPESALQEDEEKDDHTIKHFNLGSIKAVYRNLRENYEYRMRWDEAGQFFIREMELKRKYREVPSKEVENSLEIKENNWFRRNLFSLTGWYYDLSRYGESLWRPTLAGLVIVFLSTLFWSMQEDPSLKPWLPIFQYEDETSNVTKFVGFDKFGDGNHWLKAYERSIAGFIPVLSFESNIKVGIINYVIKIVGGAVVFALIAVALRRRFERRYRH
jgi:hypothetical protein